MNPTVTLRSTCYNHERFVVESLESVARQDFSSIQWIIVDDASTDDSARLIRRWLDQNQGLLQRKEFEVEFVQHKVNLGFTRTLNQILELANGNYLCGLACDDRMVPERISRSVLRLSQLPEDFAGVYSDAYVIDAAGSRGDVMFIEKHRQFGEMPDGDIFSSLLPRNFIPVPTTMIRTDLLREVGGYDESLCYEDYDMWLRLSRRYKFAFISEPLAEYRFHDDNLHKKITGWDQSNYWIYRKHIDHTEGLRRYFAHVKYLHDMGGFTEKILQDLADIEVPRKYKRQQKRLLAAHSSAAKKRAQWIARKPLSWPFFR